MKKILLIQQKMIGDVLMSTILADALKEEYPGSQVDYLINSHTLPVVEGHPAVDNFILFTPQIESNYFQLYRFLREIRKKQYTHVIDVYAKLSSNLISYFSRADMRISYYKREKTFLYTHNIKRNTEPKYNASLAVENRMRLLTPLGIDFHDISPKIYLTKEEVESGKASLMEAGIDLGRPVFMIGALGSNKTKSYPSKYMADLIDLITQQIPEVQLIFNYLPNQKDQAREIYEATSGRSKKQITFDFYPGNLRQLLAVTKACNLVIGNEGGLINMAKALNVPTFMIFSPHLKKENWFGQKDAETHTAVHLSDVMEYGEDTWEAARKNPTEWYLKLTPALLKPYLINFLNKHYGL